MPTKQSSGKYTHVHRLTKYNYNNNKHIQPDVSLHLFYYTLAENVICLGYLSILFYHK